MEWLHVHAGADVILFCFKLTDTKTAQCVSGTHQGLLLLPSTNSAQPMYSILTVTPATTLPTQMMIPTCSRKRNGLLSERWDVNEMIGKYMRFHMRFGSSMPQTDWSHWLYYMTKLFVILILPLIYLVCIQINALHRDPLYASLETDVCIYMQLSQ